MPVVNTNCSHCSIFVLISTEIDRSGPAAIATEDQQLEEEIRRANEQLAEVIYIR